MMKRKKLYLLVYLFLAACSPLVTPQSDVVNPTVGPTRTPEAEEIQPILDPTLTPEPTSEAQVDTPTPPSSVESEGDAPQLIPTNVRVEDDNDYRIPSMLPFDAIFPVYDPQFLPANQASLQDEELVMGLAIDGEAKAYPVTVLRFREMVNDEVAGWPVLVTW
jgi:hypothetical protein